MRGLTRLLLTIWIVGFAGAALAVPDFWRKEWPDTDFSKHAVPDWNQIMSGSPGKDDIPALDAPKFRPIAAETRIDPREPVIAVEIDGQTPRAYPIRYLMWHEIVNDQIGPHPVSVTFCPLCNSAITFDRRVGGKVLSFGVTGKLRFSDMVMYDRQTQSWWQQAVGKGIVGAMTGVELKQLPSWMESAAAFRARNPKGLIMDQPAYPRDYGRNPYRGYETSGWPMLYRGEKPPHGINPLARVIRVGARAWPLSRLKKGGDIREAGVVITWAGGQAAALDSGRSARGRDIGAIRVRDGRGRDLAHDVMFAFAFHAFWPKGQWMLAK